MAHGSATKPKALFRAVPTGAFDQYLHDIQKLPMISDPAEEKRVARLAQAEKMAALSKPGGGETSHLPCRQRVQREIDRLRSEVEAK